MTDLERKTKRAGLVAKARALHDLAKKETRDLTAAEQADFDKYMDEAETLVGERRSSKYMDEAETLVGERRSSKRLSDAEEDLKRRDGRKVPPYDEFSASSAPSDRMRFLTAEGKEIRALRSDEPFSSAANLRRDSLPDGIQPEELSLGRWIRACITGNFRDARAEQRVMGSGSDVTGGVTVPFDLSSTFIDLARPKTTVIKAGAQILPIDAAQLRLAKLLSDIQPQFKAENAIGNTSDATFGALTLTPRTLIGLAVVSKELAEDSSNFGSVIEHSLTESLALALDYAALLGGDGTSSGSPTGIFNTPGVNPVSLGTNGGNISYANFSTAMQLVLKANGIPRTAIFSTRTWHEIDALVDSLGNSLRPPPSWEELEKMVTSQIPENQVQGSASTCSCAYVGDFNQLILGMRSDLRIEITPFAGDSALNTFRAYQLAIRAVLRADVQLARPAHFTVISGIL